MIITESNNYLSEWFEEAQPISQLGTLLAAEDFKKYSDSKGVNMSTNEVFGKGSLGYERRREVEEPQMTYWLAQGDESNARRRLYESINSIMGINPEYKVDCSPALESALVQVSPASRAYSSSSNRIQHGSQLGGGDVYSFAGLRDHYAKVAKAHGNNSLVGIDEDSYQTFGLIAWEGVAQSLRGIWEDMKTVLANREHGMGDPDCELDGEGVGLSCRQVAESMKILMQRLSTQLPPATENESLPHAAPGKASGYIFLARAAKNGLPISYRGLLFPAEKIIKDEKLLQQISNCISNCQSGVSKLLDNM